MFMLTLEKKEVYYIGDLTKQINIYFCSVIYLGFYVAFNTVYRSYQDG